MPKELTTKEILKLRKQDEMHIDIELGHSNRNYEFHKTESFYIDMPTIYSFEIQTNKDDSFDDIISNKDAFYNAVEENNKIIRLTYNEDDLIDIDDILVNDMDYDKFFSKDFTIYMFGNILEVVHFINNNKIKDHKIVLTKPDLTPITIDDEDLIDEFISKIDYLDNIYVIGEGNDEKVCINDYKKTIKYIETIANKVKRLNLSPIEKLMYVYDIVRDRKYKAETDDENYNASRDLTSVTSGDEIVCLGFARVYDKVIKKLGFNSMVHAIIPKEIGKHGHARNMVYVKDEKYNIDGVYFFDTTFDSKKDEDNLHYNSYRNFANVYEDFLTRDHMNNQLMKDLISVGNKIYKKDQDKITYEEIKNVNTLYKILCNKSLLDTFQLMTFNRKKDELSIIYSHLDTDIDYEKLYKDIEEFVRKFYKQISLEQFIKILTNVRIQEYYENSSKFPLSKEKILEISNNYIGNDEDRISSLTNAIFGGGKSLREQIIEQNELDKDINRVRVAKVLRNVLEKKKDIK